MAAAKGGARFMTARRDASTPSSRACSRCSSIPTSIRSSPTRRLAPARTSCRRAPTTCTPNVSMADLKGFTEKYGLNSRLVKQDGKLERRGLPHQRTVWPRTSPRSSSISRPRKPFAEPPMAKALDALDQVLSHRRGSRSQGLRHRVGAGQGFAGRHHQRLHRGLPRSARREGRVGGAGVLRQPGEDAAHQDHRHQRAVVRGPHAVGRRSTASRTSRALSPTPSTWSIETGDSGPVTPIGINLPNDQEIREKYGSKSVALSNVNEAYDRSSPGSMRSEFTWSPEEAQRAEKFATLCRRAHHRHARSDRPRLGPPGRGQGEPPGADRRKSSRRSKKAAPISSACTSSPIRSWSSSASSPPPTTTTWCAPNTRPIRATRSCSCAAFAKARRSKRTTCATAR